MYLYHFPSSSSSSSSRPPQAAFAAAGGGKLNKRCCSAVGMALRALEQKDYGNETIDDEQGHGDNDDMTRWMMVY